MRTHGTSRMAATVAGLPPDHANNGSDSMANRSGSLVLAERMGPTSAGVVEWKTAMNRLIPSTRTSITTSADSSPGCGMALGSLSIFATTALRSSRSASTAQC